jgi:hypothetical protein
VKEGAREPVIAFGEHTPRFLLRPAPVAAPSRVRAGVEAEAEAD